MKKRQQAVRYYVDLSTTLGSKRFGLLLALAVVGSGALLQLGINTLFFNQVSPTDWINIGVYALVIIPMLTLLLSLVLDEREHTNQIALSDLESEVFQREKIQVELEQQGALLRSFLDNSPDIIYYRNQQKQFAGCNKAMESLVGKTEAQLLGLTPWDIYPHQIAASVVESDQQVFGVNCAITTEQWLEDKDGNRFYFELRKVPFYAKSGECLGLFGFGRDITERKRYQDALVQAAEDKTRFLSTTSHELKTPLNAIVGFSRMLLETPLSAEQKKYLRTVYVSATSLGNIFNDIIELDKSERNCLSLAPAPLDLPQFIDEIETISRFMAEQKGLRFSLEVLTPIARVIEADATRLRQILWNLVSNAVKFTPEGGVNVSVACTETATHAMLEFEVEDSGIGIAAQDRARVFELYYQVTQQQTSLQAQGTGIGLAVSQQLARLMGGDITLETELGEGSCFRLGINVALGAMEVEPPVQPQLGLATELAQYNDPQGIRVLLIEDIELNVQVAQNLLHRFGYQVEVAHCGQEALALFEHGRFNLILLDIHLPDMTGFDVAKQLKAKFRVLPPIVALTANVVSDKNEYLNQGIDEVLTKPLCAAALATTLDALLIDVKLDPAPAVHADIDIDSRITARLDMEMLTEYIALIGRDNFNKNLVLLKAIMPEYLSELDAHLVNQQWYNVTEMAHKIKGATGAVGLKIVQQWADKLQSSELDNWAEQVAPWVQKLKQDYQQDIDLLDSWLQQA